MNSLSKEEALATLTQWVVTNGRDVDVTTFTSSTPLMKSGYITSLHLIELILAVERLSRRRIDVTQLAAGDFETLDKIVQRFFL